MAAGLLLDGPDVVSALGISPPGALLGSHATFGRKAQQRLRGRPISRIRSLCTALNLETLDPKQCFTVLVSVAPGRQYFVTFEFLALSCQNILMTRVATSGHRKQGFCTCH